MENATRPRTTLALGIACLATLDIGEASAAEAQASLPPAPLRPDAEIGPTKISVAIWAADISKIDNAAQTFTASLFVGMRWHDTRLVHAGSRVKTHALADIWHPELLLANDDGSVRRTLPEEVDVTSDGTAIYRQRFTGSFAQRLDLRAFPFDQTSLPRALPRRRGIDRRKSNSSRMKRWSPQASRRERESPRL